MFFSRDNFMEAALMTTAPAPQLRGSWRDFSWCRVLSMIRQFPRLLCTVRKRPRSDRCRSDPSPSAVDYGKIPILNSGILSRSLQKEWQRHPRLSQQHKKQTGCISTAVAERRSTRIFLWKPRSIAFLIVTNTAADLPHKKKLSKKFTRCSRIPFRKFPRSRAAHLRFLGSRSLEGAISS